MQSKGLTPTVVTYTSLIGAMGHSRHPEKAWEFYEAMQASRIEPNYITFGKLIHACSRTQSVHKADEALKLYQDMGERGIQLDSFTFGALIGACKDKYPQKVTELYSEMQRLGVKPDAGTYNVVISSCDRSAHTGMAAQVVSSMNEQGCQCQSRLGAHNAMINTCGRGDKTLDDALALLKEMQTKGPAPDSVTYSTVMKLCERARRPEDALQVFDAMSRSGCAVDRICCNWALSACEQLRNVERALALFDYMKKALALEPDASTYGLLISACGKCKWGNKAAELFQELQDSKLAPTRFVYNAMIGACGNVKRIGMALDTFRMMKQEGVAPDAITFNSLISACEKRTWPERATELLREMEETGPAPDVKAYTALMSCWAKSKEPEKALEVYREMIGKGIEATAITYSTLAWACEEGGHPSWAKDFNLKEVESWHSCSANEIRTLRQHTQKRDSQMAGRDRSGLPPRSGNRSASTVSQLRENLSGHDAP
jgi:pentatricopeptide repeat protein